MANYSLLNPEQVNYSKQNKDLEAYNYLKQDTKAGRFFSGMDLTRNKEQYEYFTQEFSDSTYTGYMEVNLAKYKLAREQYQEGIEQLENVLNNNKVPFMDTVLSALIKANYEAGNHKKAKEYFDMLEKRYPYSKETQNTRHYAVYND